MVERFAGRGDVIAYLIELIGERHLSFGGGPHRCLGSHLPRQELAVVPGESLGAIADFGVVGEPIEHSAQVWGLDSLKLAWNVAG